MSTPEELKSNPKQWTVAYQRVVGRCWSEHRVQRGMYRIDGLACDGTKCEFQYSTDSKHVVAAKDRAHASGALWVFCAIHAHHENRLKIFPGATAGFEWERVWGLPTETHGRVLFDLGYSPMYERHVLLERSSFEHEGNKVYGTGTLRDAQDFCHWLKDATPMRVLPAATR
ncbi:hypothetical protein ACFWBI_22940 [Streptomyces sp. NPDC059982]|uniref:hypothetical protein n=1 Tax=unclassified Streptomyces TaxID=2593676 RepID=UPI0036BB9F66